MISVVNVLYLLAAIWANAFPYTISFRPKEVLYNSRKKIFRYFLYLKKNYFHQTNHILFERFECTTNPLYPVIKMECDVRRISQRDMKMFIRANFSEPVHSIWIHGVFNYKYNTFSYQKFPIDLWEDLCAWLNGGKPTYFLKWTAVNVRNFSNMNHPCPYSGTAWVDIKRIPLNRLIMLEPLLPSGRYR